MRRAIIPTVLLITFGFCFDNLSQEENAELAEIESKLRGFATLINPNFRISGMATLSSLKPEVLARILMKRQELIFKSKNVQAIIEAMDEKFVFEGCGAKLNRKEAVRGALENTKQRTREFKNGRFDGDKIVGEVDYLEKNEDKTMETVYPMEYVWKLSENGQFVNVLTRVLDCDGKERKVRN